MDWLRFVLAPPATPRGVDRLPDDDDNSGVRYDTDWARTPAAKAVRTAGVYAFHKPANWIYGRPHVVGADRLSDVKGPVLFAANHHSHADTSLLLATIPHHLRVDLAVVAGADYFFPNPVASVMSALFIGAIPIERKKLSKLSIERSVEVLREGSNLLIYPEGGRSPDGWGQDHKPGAAFVATRANVPVVPIYLDGTAQVLPKGKNWPTRSQMAVVFGSPLHLAEGEGARAFARRIQDQVDLLAAELTDGWWKARRKRAAGRLDPLAGPEAASWRRRWALGADAAERERKRRSANRWPLD